MVEGRRDAGVSPKLGTSLPLPMQFLAAWIGVWLGRYLSLAKTRSDGCRLHECSIGAVDHGLLDGTTRCDRGPIQHEGLVHLRRSIARGADHLPVASPSDGNGERARLRRAADVTVVESAT